MRQIKLAVFAMLFAMLGACSSLQLAQPTSTQQGIAYAYSQVAAVRQSAAQALGNGTLSVAAGQQVLTQTDAARAALDAAETATTAGDTATAAGQLAAATAILTSLQTYLTQQGVK